MSIFDTSLSPYLCTERRTNAADGIGDDEDFEEDGDGDGEGVVPDDDGIVDLLYGCVLGQNIE